MDENRTHGASGNGSVTMRGRKGPPGSQRRNRRVDDALAKLAGSSPATRTGLTQAERWRFQAYLDRRPRHRRDDDLDLWSSWMAGAR